MADNPLLASPALARLSEQVHAGNAAALDAFWRELAQRGTPLVELIPGDDEHSLVTFVYRSERAQRSEDDGSTPAIVNTLPGRDWTQALEQLPGTDVWYKSYKLPNDTRESYQFAVGGRNVTDPLNPRTLVFPDDSESGFSGWVSSVFELGNAPPQVWNTPRPDLPHGDVTYYRAPSAILEREYGVWVYTPPGYTTDGAPYGLVLALDGWLYLDLIPLPTTLDNLIAAGRLPPMVGIMVSSPLDATRQRDLSCYPPFADFVARELVPWARQNFHLAADPAQNIIVGVSLGGLMAAFIALHHSDLFGSVLAQSAFFGWRPRGEQDMWIAREYIARPLLPLRFYIEAGRFETELQTNEPGWGNFLLAARYMRDVLRAKGYSVAYSEFSGGHNATNWQGTLGEGLLALRGAG